MRRTALDLRVVAGAAGADRGDTLLGLYLEEIRRFPLLTAVEEVRFAELIERGRRAEERIAGDEDTADERAAARTGALARQHLIKAAARTLTHARTLLKADARVWLVRA